MGSIIPMRFILLPEVAVMPEQGALVNWPGCLGLVALFDCLPWYFPRPLTELGTAKTG